MTVDTLLDRAWETRRESFDKDPEERAALLESARTDIESAIDIARRDDELPLLAEALHRLANIERDLDQNDAAEVLWQESVALCRELDRPLMLAHKIRHLADLKQELDQYDDAMPLYEETMAIYRDPANTASLDHANAAMAYATLAGRLAQTDAALSLWREARALYSIIGLDEGVTICTERISEISGPDAKS